MLSPFVFGIAGYKNTGKTTLISQFIREMSQKGKRVATIKHDAHGFFAHPDHTDTASHAKAGAICTVIASPDGHTAIERHEPKEPSLADLLKRVAGVDVILVEGYKDAPIAKWVLLSDPGLGMPYTIPDYMVHATFQGKVLGFVVPRPPLTVMHSRYPVFLREDVPAMVRVMEYHMA